LSQLLLLDDRRADGVAGARALRYRIEAQFWKNEEFFYGRRFDPALDATRTSRELAVPMGDGGTKSHRGFIRLRLTARGDRTVILSLRSAIFGRAPRATRLSFVPSSSNTYSAPKAIDGVYALALECLS
jgi:hypothetical protein